MNNTQAGMLLVLVAILILQGFLLLNSIKDIALNQQDQIEISSQQLYNSNALNCYTLNNRETEKEYYQCMYDTN